MLWRTLTLFRKDSKNPRELEDLAEACVMAQEIKEIEGCGVGIDINRRLVQ